MTEYRFAAPSALQLLWLLPVLGLLSVYLNRSQAKKIAQLLGTRLAPYLTSSVSVLRRRWKLILELISLAFLCWRWLVLRQERRSKR